MNAMPLNFNDFANHSQAIDLSVSLGLLWVAHCDGDVTLKEHEQIKQYADSAPGSDIFLNSSAQKKLLSALHDPRSDLLERMCDVLKESLNLEEQQYFFQLLINIASAEESISVPKNYVLRFFLDVFEFEVDALNRAYLETSGSLLPEAGDPSSQAWWEYQENMNAAASETSSQFLEHLTVEQAKQVLGVAETATAKEIKIAYRRLAQHYHPDRHADLDESKRKKAEQSFMLIQQAYEVLK